ncbi:MAG: hypothetical protein B6I18_04430 [Bacteroidetes bacterium 4572_112]|nr:MAG: hypothetical protein B6I18_04430 [Bacteroidetes bacterium 4572_112]
MKISEYPIIRLLVSIIIGILLSKSDIINNFQWYWVIPFVIILATLAWPKRYFFSYKNRHIAGILISLIFVLIGFSLHKYNTNFEKENHFSNYIGSHSTYQLKLIEPPQNKEKTTKLICEVEIVKTGNSIHSTIGEVLIYLQKDSNSQLLSYGDIIAYTSELKPTEDPLNPDQFNYKNYLLLQGIKYQSYGRAHNWKLIQKAETSIMGFALNLRKDLLKVLEENNVKDDELSVAAGMLLGVRDMLSPELRQAYAGAGAMHILCVSGLHVGIIFMILSWLLGFISNTTAGKATKSIIIISIIWFYALLTGFSPSVVRSATMFTFIVVGQGLKRHVNIFGSLSSSAFVLLVYDPNLLFDLGFQLSYAAVTAIVIIQPPLAKLWAPRYSIINKAWQLIAVSVAAQIGTAPLSIYYFHQFPNYFILTNLIIIPAAYLIIMLGIIVVATSFIPIISALLGKGLSFFLELINYIISYIEQMQYAVTKNIYISPTILFFSILLIISMSIWILEKKKKLIFVNLSLIIILLVAGLFNYDLEDEFVFYKNRKSTYMAIYSDKQAWILCDTNVYNDHSIASFSVSGHELHKGISEYHYYLLDSNLHVKNKRFYIDYPFIAIGDKVILLNNSKIDSLDKSQYYYLYHDYNIKSTKPINKNANWIISQNIPYWESKKIIPKLDSLGINYHQIKTDGAWVVKF